MEFTVTTRYDGRAMAALARGLRKTVRKKQSRRAHVFGWIAFFSGLLLAFFSALDGSFFTFRSLVTWFAVFLIFAALVWEDALNGRVAFRRIPPGLATSNTTFDEQGYHSVTEVGSSDFPYSNIVALAQTEGYFVFVFGKNHGQVYDKAGISGGTAEQFRRFIEDKTGLVFESV